MGLILSIESTGTAGSVAVHRDGYLVGEINIHLERSHAKLLASNIKLLLDQLGFTFNHLDAVAVSGGPGSYTGLRIGISTAKGICFGASLPLIHIDTLDIMASSVHSPQNTGYLLCPMIDARRMEVYYSLIDNNLNTIVYSEPAILDEEFLLAYREHPMLIFGDGAEKADEYFDNHNWIFLRGIFPKAADMGNLAHNKYVERKTEDLILYEPNYIKPFKTTEPKPGYGNS